MVGNFVQKAAPLRPRIFLHVTQRGAPALVRHQQQVYRVGSALFQGAAAAAAAAFAPTVVEEEAHDIEAGLHRPADLVERETPQVVAGGEGASVRDQEAEDVQVSTAAGDVDHRLAELVGRVLQKISIGQGGGWGGG